MQLPLHHVIEAIENFAPLALQEKYDNAGLLVGNPQQIVSKALLTLDCTEETIEEAIAHQCDLIIAHHPIIFTGIKSITGKSFVERILIKAIQQNIAIYAAHTNLDNIHQGVNFKIASILQLHNLKILHPAQGHLKKIQTFVPISHQQVVKDALAAAGAGQIGNYSHCSFSYEGVGNFKPNDLANPFLGEINEMHTAQELKIEMIFPAYIQSKIIDSLLKSHPYETVSYDIIPLDNKHPDIGAGIIGMLEKPTETITFLNLLKDKFKSPCVRYTKILQKNIQKIAICGGSGSFLLPQAIQQDADVFVSADFKYHDFFNAENKIVIADIGHYESEQYTTEIFFEILSKKFPKFALLQTRVQTNPVYYL